MACRVERKANTGKIVNVLKPNGLVSEVYKKLNLKYKNAEVALRYYMLGFTEDYIDFNVSPNTPSNIKYLAKEIAEKSSLRGTDNALFINDAQLRDIGNQLGEIRMDLYVQDMLGNEYIEPQYRNKVANLLNPLLKEVESRPILQALLNSGKVNDVEAAIRLVGDQSDIFNKVLEIEQDVLEVLETPSILSKYTEITQDRVSSEVTLDSILGSITSSIFNPNGIHAALTTGYVANEYEPSFEKLERFIDKLPSNSITTILPKFVTEALNNKTEGINTDEYARSRQLGFDSDMALTTALGASPIKTIESPRSSLVEIENVKKRLKLLFGNNVQVSTALEQTLDNIGQEGLPGGFFLDNVIYLHDADVAGHEAFHKVFHTLLTDKQATVLLNEAKKNLNYSKKQLNNKIADLILQVPAYSELSRERLENLVYEEYMADEYQEFFTNNKTPENWLMSLFNLIKNVFSSVWGNRTQLEALFHKINNRGFAFTKPKSNKYAMELPVFKLLTIGKSKDASNRTIDIVASESDSNALIYEMAGRLYEIINTTKPEGSVLQIAEDETITLTPSDALRNPEEAVYNIMRARSYEYSEENNIDLLEQLEDEEEKLDKLVGQLETKEQMYSPKFSSQSNISNGVLVWEEVQKLFQIFGTDYLTEKNEVAAENKMTAESLEMQNKSAYEYDPLELRDKDLRTFMGFILYEKTDELTGNKIKVAIDSSRVYSNLLVAMSSKELHETPFNTTQQPFLTTLAYYAKDNDETRAFYNKLMEISGGKSDHNLVNLVRKSLDNMRISFTQLLQDPNTGNFQLVSAANIDDVVAQLDTWDKNWNDSGLSDNYNSKARRKENTKALNTLYELLDPTKNGVKTIMSLDNPMILDSTTGDYVLDTNTKDNVIDKFINGFTANNGREIKSLFKLTGIDLSRGFIRYSILREYDLIATSNITEYTQLQDIISNKDYQGYKELAESEIEHLTRNDIREMVRILGKNYKSDEVEEYVKETTGVTDLRNIHIDTSEVIDPESDKIIFAGGMVGRLKDLAKGNVYFDETLIPTSFQDSTGNQRFNFVKKSFLLLTTLRLQNKNYRKQLQEKYPHLKNNILFNTDFFSEDATDKIFGKDFIAKLIGDVRQRNMGTATTMDGKQDEQAGTNRSTTESGEGVTPKTVDYGTFMILNLAMFAKRKTVRVANSEGQSGFTTLQISDFFTGPNEIKRTDIAVPLPVGRNNLETGKTMSYTTLDGDFSRAAIDTVYQLFENELDLVKEGEQEIKDGLLAYENFYRRRPDAEQLAKNRIELIELKRQVRLSQLEGNALERALLKINELENQFSEEPTSTLYEGFHVRTDSDGNIKKVIDDSGNVTDYQFGRATELWNFKKLVDPNSTSYTPALVKYMTSRKRLLTLDTKMLLGDSLTPQESADYNALKAATPSALPVELRAKIKEGLRKYLDEQSKDYISKLDKYDVIDLLPNGDVVNNKIPALPYYYPSGSNTPFRYYQDSKNNKDNYKWFIKDYFVNHYINASSYNEIMDKDARIAKDPVDRVKRNGGKVGNGDGAGSGKSKFGVVKEAFLINKLGVESERADAQSQLSLEGYEFLLRRWGRFPDVIKPIFNKIKFGLEEVTFTEVEKLTDLNVILNSKKTMLYDGEFYHKLSYSILSRQYTSVLPKKNRKAALELKEEIELAEKNGDDTTQLWHEYESLWRAHPGHSVLHNLRRNMLFNDIYGVIPQSASKLKTPVAATNVNGHFDFGYNMHELDNEFWRLQMETPSGKSKITYFSQVLNLIDNEIDKARSYKIRGIEYKMSDIIQDYHKMLARRVENSMQSAMAELGKLDDDGYLNKLDIEKFQAKLYETLQSSGADDSLLSFFRESIKGGTEMKYDANLPAISAKFQQLFLAHFSKGVMQATTVGRKVSLIADWGNEVIVGIDDNIIKRTEIEKNYDTYVNEDGSLKDGYTKRRLKWSTGYATDTDITVKGKTFTNVITREKLIEGFLDDGKVIDLVAKTGINTLEKIESLSDDILVKIWGELEDYKSMSLFGKYIDFNKVGDITDENYEIYDMSLRARLQDNYDDIVELVLGKDNYIDNAAKYREVFGAIEGRLIGTPVDQSVSEVLMPAWDAFTHGVSVGDTVDINHPAWESIMTQFGTRIPTQDKHSMIVFKVVDFLPSYMGDVAVLPMETILLSGEDFDIDAKYIQRKSYYLTKEGTVDKINIHGEIHDAKSEEAKYKEVLGEDKADKFNEIDAIKHRHWRDFLVYVKKNNRAVKYDFKKLQKAELATEEYQTLLQEIEMASNLGDKLLYAELSDKKKDRSNQLLLQAMTENNLPSSFEEFDVDALLNNDVVNNIILDYNMALYLNAGTVAISYTPASMTKIQGNRDTGVRGIAELVNYITGDDLSSYEYNTANGQMTAKVSNKTGDDLIGPAAVANIVKAALAKSGVNLRIKPGSIKASIGFDSTYDFNTFANYHSNDVELAYSISNGNIRNVSLRPNSDGEYTTKQYRIMDELSTVLSAMTDNAKHNDAAKLNFTLDTLGAYLYMVSLGMGLNRAVLVSKSPVMVHYNKIKAASDTALVTEQDKDRNSKNSEKLIEEAYETASKLILERIEQLEKKDTKKQLNSVNYRNNENFKHKDLVDITPQDSGNLNLDSGYIVEDMQLARYLRDTYGMDYTDSNFDKSVIDTMTYDELIRTSLALTNQLDVLTAFTRLAQQGSYLTSLSRILRLHQGLKPSFHELQGIYDSLDDFGIDLRKVVSNVADYNTANYNELQMPFSINKVLDKNIDLKVLLKSFDKVMKASKHLFISQSNTFENVFNTIKQSLRRGLQGRDRVLKNIKGQMMGFTIINSMREKYKREGRTFPFDSAILYSHSGDTIYNRLQNIIKIAKKNNNNELGNNLFIKALRRTPNKASTIDMSNYLPDEIEFAEEEFLDNVLMELDELTVNTRTKNTPEFNNRVISAYRELMTTYIFDENGKPLVNDAGKSVVTEFAEDLFNYLIIRDGLQFKHGSYLKYIAPEMYLEMSNVLKELTKAFKDDRWVSTREEQGIRDLLGMDEKTFKSQFTKMFGLNPKNQEMFGEFNFSRLWSVHKDFKENMGIDENPGIINMYDSDGKLLEENHDYDFPEFFEIDLSNIKSLVDNQLVTAIQSLYNKHGMEAIKKYPALGFFKMNGQPIYFNELTKDERKEFDLNEGKYVQEAIEAKNTLRNEILTYGDTQDSGTATAIVAGQISRISRNTINYVKGKLSFPRFITLTNDIIEEEENYRGFVVEQTVTEKNLFMLINIPALPILKDSDGKVIPAPPELIAERDRGVYVKVNPIYTSLYPYLHSATDFKEVMLKNVLDKEKQVKKKFAKLSEIFAGSAEQKYFSQLRETILNQRFDYELYEGKFSAVSAAEAAIVPIKDRVGKLFSTSTGTAMVNVISQLEFNKRLISNDFSGYKFGLVLFEADIDNITKGKQRLIIMPDELKSPTTAGESDIVTIKGQEYLVHNLGLKDLDSVLLHLQSKGEGSKPTEIFNNVMDINAIKDGVYGDFIPFDVVNDEVDAANSKGKKVVLTIERYQHSNSIPFSKRPYYGIQNINVVDLDVNISKTLNKLKNVNVNIASLESLQADLVINFSDNELNLNVPVIDVKEANEEQLAAVKEILTTKGAYNLGIVNGTQENLNDFIKEAIKTKSVSITTDTNFPYTSYLSKLLGNVGYKFTAKEILKATKLDIPYTDLSVEIIDFVQKNYEEIRKEMQRYNLKIRKEQQRTQLTFDFGRRSEYIQLAFNNPIQQNFFDGSYFLERENADGTKIFGQYKTKSPGETSIGMVQKGLRTETTRSKSSMKMIENLAVAQGIIEGIEGTIVYMVDDNPKSPTNGQNVFAKITTNEYTPNREDFVKFEGWAEEVWDSRGRVLIDRGYKSFQFETINVNKSEMPVVNTKTFAIQPTSLDFTMSNVENHSGGAYGADTLWDAIGRRHGVESHYHYRDKDNVKLSKTLKDAGVKAMVLTEDELEHAYFQVEKLLGLKLTKSIGGNLKARNYYQVVNSDSVLAIANLVNAKNVMGGTNVAVQLGIKLGKPVYVFDLGTRKWHRWNGNEFVVTETPTLTQSFAGIGTRTVQPYNIKSGDQWILNPKYTGDELANVAKQAIIDVYEKTAKATDNGTKIKESGVTTPFPGVEYIAETGLTVEKANQFIDLIAPQIENQAYVENASPTANYMFSFGARWARKVPGIWEKSLQGDKVRAGDLSERPNRIQINQKETRAYSYFSTDQNNKALPPISDLAPIISYIEENLKIDLSDYDAALGNLYFNNSFIHQHRDTTESKFAEGYEVVVINLGADGSLYYDNDLNSSYNKYQTAGELPLGLGSIYSFGAKGKNRFKFHHRIKVGLDSKNPLKPITLPNGKKVKDYRATITFRRVKDLGPNDPKYPARTIKPKVEKPVVTEPNIKGEEISSYSDGLGFALTNPTFVSPRGTLWRRNWTVKQTKWRDYMANGIEFEGTRYKDVENAYQRNKEQYDFGDEKFELMMELIQIKLRTYPKLVDMIDAKGGLDYIFNSTHQPTKGNSNWETGGNNDFIKALGEAYRDVSKSRLLSETNKDDYLAYAESVQKFIENPKAISTYTGTINESDLGVSGRVADLDFEGTVASSAIKRIRSLYAEAESAPRKTIIIPYTNKPTYLGGFSLIDMASMFAQAGYPPKNIMFNSGFAAIIKSASKSINLITTEDDIVNRGDSGC